MVIKFDPFLTYLYLSKMNSKMNIFSASETSIPITTEVVRWNMRQMLDILAKVQKTEEVENLVMDFMDKIVEIVPNVEALPLAQNLLPLNLLPPEPSGVAKNVDAKHTYIVDFMNPGSSTVDMESIRKRLENMPPTTTHLILNSASVTIMDHLAEKGFADTATKNLEVLELVHGDDQMIEWYSEDMELLVKFCDALNINLSKGKAIYPRGDKPLNNGFPNDRYGRYVIWSINILDIDSTKDKIGSVEFPNHVCNTNWKNVYQWQEFVKQHFNKAREWHGNDAVCEELTFWVANYTQQEWGEGNYVIVQDC